MKNINKLGKKQDANTLLGTLRKYKLIKKKKPYPNASGDNRTNTNSKNFSGDKKKKKKRHNQNQKLKIISRIIIYVNKTHKNASGDKNRNITRQNTNVTQQNREHQTEKLHKNPTFKKNKSKFKIFRKQRRK